MISTNEECGNLTEKWSNVPPKLLSSKKRELITRRNCRTGAASLQNEWRCTSKDFISVQKCSKRAVQCGWHRGDYSSRMKRGGESYGVSKSRLWNKNVEMKSGRFPKTDACKQDGRCFTDDLTKGDKAAVGAIFSRSLWLHRKCTNICIEDLDGGYAVLWKPVPIGAKRKLEAR